MQRLPFIIASLVTLLVSSLSVAQGADTLKVAVSPWYYPVIFEGDDKKIQGIDADLVQAIAETLGKKVEFRAMARNNIGAAVAAGDVDIGMSSIESRSYLRDYNTAPFDHKKIRMVDYFELPAFFVVRKEETKDVSSLKGKFVASLSYTASREILSSWQSSNLVGKVFGFENEDIMVNSFKLKRVQGVLVTLPTANELIAKSGGTWTSFPAAAKGKKISEPIALILPTKPADPSRGKKIAEAVERFLASGKVKAIASKWIDNP